MATTMYPYPTLTGNVSGVVTRVDIDGTTPPQLELIRTEHGNVVNLAGPEIDWTNATLHVDVSGPMSEIAVLDDEGADPVAYAMVQCSRSNTRRGVRLERDDRRRDTWRGKIELEREEWFGSAQLTFAVVAAVEGVPWRVIGEAPQWTLSLDDLPPIDVDGTLPMRWVDFGADNALGVLRAYDDLPVYVYLDPDEPVLYLNKGFDGLPSLLDDANRITGLGAVVRDSLLSDVAARAWAGLFQASLAAVAERTAEDEQATWPDSRWQRAVLQALLPRMYPDVEPEEALRQAVEASRSADGTSVLTSLAIAAADQHSKVPRALRKAFNKFEEDVA